MSEFLGEEFIRIHADASTFRAELQTQVAAALAGTRLTLPTAATGTSTAAAASAAAAASKATRQQQQAAAAARAQGEAQRKLGQEQRQAAASAAEHERSLGRLARGSIASAAASTGLFRAVSFASGAFLAGAVAGATAAVAFREFAEASRVAAQTQRIIESTGGAANVTAEQVDKLANAQLRLTGIDDELIKTGANVILTFRAIQNQVGQGNNVFDRAVKAAIDISTVFGTNLRSSAIQVGKALQDPVRGVTALRRAGVTLSQSQRDLIKRLVETGQILTAQKIILSEVERQVGGTAEAVGKTLPGQFDILKERATNALGDLAARLSASSEAADAAQFAIVNLRGAFEVLAAVLRPTLAALGLFARGLGLLARGEVAAVRFFQHNADVAFGFKTALSDLNDSMVVTRQNSQDLAAAQEALAGAQFDVRDATRDVHAAELSLAASRAEPGSVERAALEDELAAAEERLGKSQRDVAFQQRRVNRERADAIRLQREQHDVIDRTIVSLQQQFGEIQRTANARAGPLAPTGQLRDLREQMQALSESGTRAEKVIAGVIGAFTVGPQRFPRADELRKIVELAVRGGSSRSIFDALGLAQINGIELLRIKNAQALAAGIGQENTALQEQVRALRAARNAEQEIVNKRRERFQTAQQEAQQARDNLRIAQETLRVARQAVVDARQALADTVRSAADAVTDAVNSAKQNLRSLADAIAEALGRITGDTGQLDPALRKRFAELQRQVLQGGGGPGTQRAAQAIAALAAGRHQGAEQFDTRLQDLSNDLAFGRISVGQFNQRLNRFLRDIKFNPQAFAREFGTAARDELVFQISQLRAQAAAVPTVQRPGGGFADTVVRPLEAVAQANKDINNATREVRDRVRDLANAERERNQARKDYEQKNLVQQREHTRLLRAINQRDAAQARLSRARDGNRPKGGGGANRESTGLSAAGAKPQ